MVAALSLWLIGSPVWAQLSIRGECEPLIYVVKWAAHFPIILCFLTMSTVFYSLLVQKLLSIMLLLSSRVTFLHSVLRFCSMPCSRETDEVLKTLLPFIYLLICSEWASPCSMDLCGQWLTHTFCLTEGHEGHRQTAVPGLVGSPRQTSATVCVFLCTSCQ